MDPKIKYTEVLIAFEVIIRLILKPHQPTTNLLLVTDSNSALHAQKI